MPPKKKKGGGKAKDDNELTLEQKYKKALEEIETLKEMLSINREKTQLSHAISKECSERTRIAEQNLAEFNEGQACIKSDVARQHKTVATEVGFQFATLDYKHLQIMAKHDSTRKKLHNTQKQSDRLREEKDKKIADQIDKITTTETQYEYGILDALDSLVDKVDGANKEWEDTTLQIQADHKRKIISFGHTPLEF